MGLLDNNKVLTTPRTGLEGSDFKLMCSNDSFDAWLWSKEDSRKKLRVTFRDIYAWSDDDCLYLVKGEITDTPTQIQVNTDNFPNLRSITYTEGGVEKTKLPVIDKVIACPCTFVYGNGAHYGYISGITGQSCRICVIFNNGQVYHNYPSCNDEYDFYNGVWAIRNVPAGSGVLIEDLFTKFDESVVWDLPSRKHPVKTTAGNDATLIATGKYYYNPALPDGCYEMHPSLNHANAYGNTGFGSTNVFNNISNDAIKTIETIDGQPNPKYDAQFVANNTRARFWRTNMNDSNANSFSYMGGYITDTHFAMIGTYQSNTGNLPCRTCVFGTQDGGRSWYCMYEFLGIATQGVSLAQTGSAGTGLYSVSKRTVILPSAENKEPSSVFEYGSPVNISSISGSSSGITITTADSHGLLTGDVVVIKLQNAVSLNSRTFDWMVNEDASSNSGGNGILFFVEKVDATSFKVSFFPYNADNALRTRHIHALNRCKDGVTINTGEDIPNGGWILYNPIKISDNHANYNVAYISEYIRLNSLITSAERTLGSIVQQVGKDTYLFAGFDTPHIPMNDVEMPEGRTETFKHNACGVWRIPLPGVDSVADNGDIIYNSSQLCYGFQKIANALIFKGEQGELAISYDSGDNWYSTIIPNCYGQIGCHFSSLTYDRKFSIDNLLVQLKK